MDASAPKIRSLRATPVNVPLARPHPTASGVVGSAPLVLLDLETDEGLSRLLGGAEKPIPAYHSLGMAVSEGAAQEAAESIGLGFRCVKFKVGYSHVEQDRAVIRAARRAAGEDLQVMVDYNQSLSVPEAIRRVQLLEEEALVWVEEPTRADDFARHVRIAAQCRTSIQIGENFWDHTILPRASRPGPQTS